MSQCVELAKLIDIFPHLFADTLSQTHLIQHNIEVGEAKSVKHNWVLANNGEHLDGEVKFMLEDNITKKSSSSWAFSSQNLIGLPGFALNFGKVDGITSQLHFNFNEWMTALTKLEFVSKFDLLKLKYVPLTKRVQEIAAFVTRPGHC